MPRLLRMTCVALAFTLPVFLVSGMVAVVPTAALLYFEHVRFGDRMLEIAAIEASPPRSDDALEWQGGSISDQLATRYDVFDAARARREARARMALALRIGFVLAWGFAFLSQAVLGPVVYAGASDRWRLSHMRHAPSGLRRGALCALALSIPFSIGFGGLAWLGPVWSVWLPIVALGMLLATVYVLVPARTVETDGIRASAERSAELTKGHRVKLFLVVVGILSAHVASLLALTTHFPGRRLDGPLALHFAIMVTATCCVFPTFAALFAAVAYHRLREVRDAPTKLEGMAASFT